MSEQIIEQLSELVSPAYADCDAQSLLIRSSALVSCLKSLNRAANTATRTKKDETTAARQEMDQSHLGLQNLLYEKRHLEREIEKCRQFASVYQDIPLYTMDEFKQLAPEEARTPAALEDEHQLMLNRLSFELAERQRLNVKRLELVQAKEELLKRSRTNVNTLDSVKSHIDALVKTASDIQKKVDELVQPLPASDDSISMVTG
ncbi:Fms-interacting protein-domain-containing protein [Rhodocollybia butyracea]|uniref:Fms-interacting protein-domain-containing protein n=1 Tax=Rhodocollybia butyracea TaxID=206335 RepID=A0A9P5UE30_9AGAR|nr:Fms-interacting protein-domain-containing protein [Rhodocollybia butyracea]